MRHIRRTLLVALASALLAMAVVSPAAFATETQAPASQPPTTTAFQDEGAASERAVEPVILWSLTGIAAGAVVLGMLYLLKRRIGGFPENPPWVAPIFITPSSDNPTEETFGAAPDHDSHGSGH